MWFYRTEDLNREEWATSVVMGAAVLPLGVIMRFLPPSIEGERNFAGYKPRCEYVQRSKDGSRDLGVLSKI